MLKEKNDFSPPVIKSLDVDNIDSVNVVPDLGIPRTNIRPLPFSESISLVIFVFQKI